MQVLIYVFDAESIDDKDMEYYTKIIANIREFSPDAKVFCLVHKMDLISAELRESAFQDT